jgi:hypothetical protein
MNLDLLISTTKNLANWEEELSFKAAAAATAAAAAAAPRANRFRKKAHPKKDPTS